ncbi:MAG: hypothetical protein RJQ14_01425, partial [Marinoscillum sp.]
TKLSLWLKTAHADKPLNNLDNNIKCGNSLVAPLSDKAEHTELNLFEELPGDARPFDWQAGVPQVFEAGGFDVVLGNPPYVRQEVITPYKNYLEYTTIATTEWQICMSTSMKRAFSYLMRVERWLTL